MNMPISTTRPPFELEVFHDGACPLCAREVLMVQRVDRGAKIRFVDISSEMFDPSTVGVSWEALMDRIHGRLADGTIIEGVEVFRRMYAAIGFRWVVAITRVPGVSQALDLAYRVFAKNRLRLTGRCAEGSCERRRRGHAEAC